MAGLDGLSILKGFRPKTRTPGWLARLLPCCSSVGSDWFTSVSPRIFLNCLGPHRYGPFVHFLLDESQTFQLFFQYRERAT